MLAGLILSFMTAVSMAVGNLLEKHAVDHMAELTVRRARRMVVSLLTSRIWLAGFIISFAGLCFQVVAFALAPLAVVQSVYGAGLVLLVLGSRVVFREAMGRRELVGLAVIVVAVVLVGASLGTKYSVGVRGSSSLVVLVSVCSALVALLLFAVARRAPLDPSFAFGIVSGLFYGISALGTKGASTLVSRFGLLGSVPHQFESPYPYLFIVASVFGLATFQTGLQRCRIGVVAPLSSVVSSTYVVIAGMALFAEQFPGDLLRTVLRFGGFAGVLLGTFILAGGGAANLRSGPSAEAAPFLAEASIIEAAIVNAEPPQTPSGTRS